jgi:PKD repeat protein
VQFTDTSTGTPTSWHWDFGDGNTSTLQNPSHTYTATGDYTVTLTVTNAYGEDTKTSYVYVYIPWVPSFTASPTSGSAPLTVQFTDTSTDDPFDWWWYFGDGDMAYSVQNPSHTYTTPGTYTVTLFAVNRYEEGGEVIREGYITVSAPPTPTLSPTPTASSSSSSSPHPLPYSQQRKETLSFLLMCWGALAFVGVFCIVIFLVMNGAQRGAAGSDPPPSSIDNVYTSSPHLSLSLLRGEG